MLPDVTTPPATNAGLTAEQHFQLGMYLSQFRPDSSERIDPLDGGRS